MEAIGLLLVWLVTTGLTFLVVVLDERRLGRRDEARLERAWPPTSRDAAIIALGPLALPFHFARTRGRFFSLDEHHRWWMGLGMGIIATIVVLLAATACEWVFDVVTGLPTD